MAESSLPVPAPAGGGQLHQSRIPHLTDFTVTIPSSASSNRKQNRTSEAAPPRWYTPEFYFYGAVFLIVVPIMVYIPVSLSSSNAVNYHLYAHRLSPGWLFGRNIDISDPQYSTFRQNIPALLGLASAYLVGSQVYERFGNRLWSRSTNIAILSIILIFVLHGLSGCKVLLILSLNYAACGPFRPTWTRKAWPAVLIVAHMGVLMMNAKMDGYKLSGLSAELGMWEQRWSGFLPRWHVNFNITMLRMVSYGLDRYWHAPRPDDSQVPQNHRERTIASLPMESYGFVNYVAYCLYPPLYIAGPIMTFNDFAWQISKPLAISRQEKLSYTIRFVFCLLSMESVLHTMYVVAIKDTKAWYGDGPAALSMIGFWNLVIVWLKLLIPWRFFRLWALLDGIDPPENMVRCVANNYSTLGFWKSWHRSYNLWVVRYIYIPVGGSRTRLNQALATLLVFSFVALWHDLSMNLLWWGWLISLFILPEIIARLVFPAEKYGQAWWYRHLCACGGVINVLMMMSANLIGFVLGVDGMKHLLGELGKTWSGWGFVLFSCACLFIAVQVMFEYREEEKRRGIDRGC